MIRITLLILKNILEYLIVHYQLPINKELFNISDYINKQITINFSSEINCVRCGIKIKKTFAQGFCFPCFQNSPETSECILKPELCQAQNGIARDLEWAKQHCLKNHYVYLSLTSGIKVGVTRATQIPTRWIDQGAVKAIKFSKTPNRFTAGLIEVFLKQFVCSCSMDQVRRRLLKDCAALLKKQIFLFQCTNAYFLSSGSGQMML